MTFEVLVLADVRHGAQYIDERTPTRPAQRGLKDLAMLLLRAPVVSCGPLFQGFNELFRKIANHELCHGVP